MLKTSYKFGEVHKLLSQVYANPENVEFRSIFDNSNGGVSLLAFKKGQVLAEHVAPAEVMVNVMEGSIEFTMAGTPHTLNAGDFMLVGEGVAHSVVASEDSKVMLVKIKSDK